MKRFAWIVLVGFGLLLLGAGGSAPPSPGSPGVTARGHAPPVRAVATSNCTLTNCTVTTDGVTLVAGDRELRVGQTTAADNGIYVVGTVTAGNAPRTAAPEFAAAGDKVQGSCLRVTEGSTGRGQWCLVGSSTNWAMPERSVKASDFGVMTTSADNTAALNAAITAAGTRGRVELNAGTYNFASATLASTPVLITGAQRLIGTGWDTIFTVTGSTAVPNFIKISPSAAMRGVSLKDFYITACATCSHAIYIDGSSYATFDSVFDHIRVDQVGYAGALPLVAPSTEDLSKWALTRAAATTATQIVTDAGVTTTYFLTSPTWANATGGTPIAITFRVKAGTLNTLELYDNGSVIGKVKADGTILTQTNAVITSLGVQGDSSWRYRMVYTGNAALVLFACSPSTFSDTWTSLGGDTLGVVIENVTQNQGVAIYADGTGGGNGTPVLAQIKNSWFLGGGIEFLSGGDTNTIADNLFGGQGRAIDLSSQGGSSTLVFRHNNVQSAGGIRLGNYVFGAQITNNEIEYVTAGYFSGSRRAIVDLDGPSLQSPIVKDNSFQIAGGGSGVTADSIRVNDAADASIVGNVFQRGRASQFSGAPNLTFAEVGATGDTITRAAGNWINDAFAIGDIVTVSGAVATGGYNNVTGRIANLSATVLTFGSTDLINEGPIAGCNVIGNTSHDVRVEALATNAKIGTNDWVAGPPWLYVLSNSGTHTQLLSQYQDTYLIGNNQAFAAIDEIGTARRLMEIDGSGIVHYGGYRSAAAMASTSGGTFLYDETSTGQVVVNSALTTVGALSTSAQLGGTTDVVVTRASHTTVIGGNGTTDEEKLEGRGAAFLMLAAACRATGTADRFAAYQSGTAVTCTTKCATYSGPATCVKGWTLFSGSANYEYGTECGTAMTDASMSGKLCCCTGSGTAEVLFP